jgi:outer membrane protein OmpA-like peptidoglycan-associated protein
MKKAFLFLFILCFHLNCICQLTLSGTWQGLLASENQGWELSEPIYFSISCIGSSINGESREEKYNTASFCSKIINGKLSDGKSIKSIVFSQTSTLSKWSDGKASCLLSFSLRYNDTTGYFEGSYSSTTCPTQKGYIKLYKSTTEVSQSPKPLVPHTWVDRFRSDLILGLSAPDERKKELKNFKFESIYFDYNSDSIPSTFNTYLNNMARIIIGHSDLRIKIIGNTDWDGSDKFNENLSRRRAESLTSYLENQGIKRDRIIIEYNGEKAPIESNSTPQGRQKNRRVDFKFI